MLSRCDISGHAYGQNLKEKDDCEFFDLIMLRSSFSVCSKRFGAVMVQLGRRSNRYYSWGKTVLTVWSHKFGLESTLK